MHPARARRFNSAVFAVQVFCFVIEILQ